MLLTVNEYVGNTLRTTWVNSGATVSQPYSALIDKEGILVSSVAQTSSGNGFYYADITLPNTPGNYLNKQGGVIDSNTYTRWAIVRLIAPEVD
jgi:hypothetical protein